MLLSIAASSLAIQLAGKILLDVEHGGAAWYVNPVNEERYSLGSPDDAWQLMRALALGISNADLAKPLPSRLSGRILLAVEDHGKAYYVEPGTMKLWYLGRPSDAFRVMTELGLGITSADLEKISSVPRTSVLQNNMTAVQFTSQAPFGDWSDPRQAEGCEEASAFMAVSWARGLSFTAQDALAAITGASDWENSKYGTYFDTSADDTAERILNEYFGFINYRVEKNISTDNIRAELSAGNIVLVPVNGQKLENPNFQNGGPLRHMILVTGFDPETNEFVTNDPGTRLGEKYRYSVQILENALMDYPSGNHALLQDLPTAMIVVRKIP